MRDEVRGREDRNFNMKKREKEAKEREKSMKEMRLRMREKSVMTIRGIR